MSVIHHDHPIEKPGCDFCSRSKIPAWRYECEDFIIGEFGPNIHASTGAWMACDPCSELIEAEAWDALAQRLVAAFQPVSDIEADRIAAIASETHRRFRIHRIGEARQPVRE